MDTGALVALFQRPDDWYERMRDWLATATGTCVVPATVIQETAYFMGTREGARAEAAFVRTMAAGEFRLEALDEADLARSADLMDAYADFPIGLVDASIVAVAERLEITDLLTTDRRHFGAIRPAHCERLRLLP